MGICVSLQPREALLKYAGLAESDPQWTAGKSFRYHLPFEARPGHSRCGVPILEGCRGGGLNLYCCICIDLPADVAAALSGVFLFFFFSAWQQNQPKPVFANVSEDEEEEK